MPQNELVAPRTPGIGRSPHLPLFVKRSGKRLRTIGALEDTSLKAMESSMLY